MTTQGIEVTAELEIQGADPAARSAIAGDICYVLSLARGTKVQWISRLDYSPGGAEVQITDWNAGALVHWSPQGSEALAKGFKGPADFCVVPETGGWLIVVPDLVQGELRLVRLAR